MAALTPSSGIEPLAITPVLGYGDVSVRAIQFTPGLILEDDRSSRN